MSSESSSRNASYTIVLKFVWNNLLWAFELVYHNGAQVFRTGTVLQKVHQYREDGLSDHSPFWDEGYRAVMITDTAFFRNPHYHQQTDTLDTLDLEFLKNVTMAISGFLKLYLS